MKAVRYNRFGDSDVLAYGEIERPTPTTGQVLVRVAGTSFNPVDAAIRAGYLAEAFPVAFPHVPGIDVAGTIAERGDEAGDWQVGQAVVAFLPMNADGAAAEYVVAPVEALAAAPQTVNLADAAALPAVGLTAWQALFDHAGVKVGQTVLVNGAGGAVGGYAVQLAKRAGAVVTATAGAPSVERLRDYGADRTIGYLDYVTTPPTVDGAPFDIVLNLVTTTPEQTAGLVELVKDGGVLVSTTTPAPEDPARGVRTVQLFARSDAAQLAGLVQRVDAGELRIDVAARRPLDELAVVHREAGAGQRTGKVVLVP
ncbi:NADP-dependent oxidoreductase [Mycobacterium sp. 21AC1]|uniref:NADP-dependent oxidoreductase n=1 Tax=[Mycobacterium] appelbergii TaxID=2939269 RepID=UPI00293951DF|nr:NADP-dependent oxidoreductase [Mycobacterium sp. 21AC1]MDV3128970.1 NADP-dependent oxidoreductase [Mycobacterium sp. 21AC1]